MNGSDENLCPCEDCERERSGEPRPDMFGLTFLLVTLFVLLGVSFWRILF